MIRARGAVIGFGSASGARSILDTKYLVRREISILESGVERAGSVSAAATEFQKSALRRALERAERRKKRAEDSLAVIFAVIPKVINPLSSFFSIFLLSAVRPTVSRGKDEQTSPLLAPAALFLRFAG